MIPAVYYIILYIYNAEMYGTIWRLNALGHGIALATWVRRLCWFMAPDMGMREKERGCSEQKEKTIRRRVRGG